MAAENVNDDQLDFAYRYPFSSEARQIIALDTSKLDEKLLRAGALRVEEDLNAKELSVPQTSLRDFKYTYMLSYVYSRMLISAINSPYHTKRYAHGEAVRARKALRGETFDRIMRLFAELGMNMSYMNGSFSMNFESYLAIAPKNEDFALIRQKVERGLVYLEKEEAAAVAEGAIENLVLKNLPIKANELPKEVGAYAKKIKLPEIKTELKADSGAYRWIEKVLATPIHDVRHRTVNLILAPYLVNVRGMSEDQAASVILEYIEKCKELNPDTNVNSTYVKYQCRYAKAKGMRPLSLERAKEMFRGVLKLD